MGEASSRLDLRLRRDLLERPDQNFAALDGMRGFASMIVLTYHCAIFMGFLTDRVIAEGRYPVLRAVVNGFWSGIDIFFVLSGFLIGRILIRDLVAGNGIRYRRFMIRRSFRIFPACYLVLLSSLFLLAPLGVGLFHFMFQTSDWSELAASSWSNFVYLNNYVIPPNAPNILSWGWSLCVEEHFYLVLPPLLYGIFRARGPRVRPSLVGLLVVLPVAGRGLQYLHDPSLQLLQGFYYYSHNRFDEIFVGVFIAYLYVVHPERLRAATERLGAAVPAAGVLCVAAVWVMGGLHKTGGFPIVWQFLVMALGSGLLLINGLYRRDLVTRFFAHRAWYPLARISYGTYLLHPFVLFGMLSAYRAWLGTVPVGPASFTLVTLAVIVLSSIAAAVMFVVLERPLLDYGARLAKRQP